jgi:hypothetical protein
MIALLASVVGYICSIVPELIKILKDKNDKQHELQILDRQLAYDKKKHNAILEEIRYDRDLMEKASIYSTYKSGVSWVDGINAMVRPVLAYSFFCMYVTVKFMQYKAISSSALLVEYIDVIWNMEDHAIFAGIISFYFGQRTFRKPGK